MTTGTFVVFSSHVFSISISRSLYFESFATVFKEVFFLFGTGISMSRQVLFSLSFTSMSGLFALISFVSLDWHVPEYSHCAFFVMVIARLHCDILAVIKCDFSSFLFSRGSVFKIE